ncbi:hypothetical protein S83_070351 [Arachis hypogaea]|nr:Putative callose synthase [Arachis hypogaea]
MKCSIYYLSFPQDNTTSISLIIFLFYFKFILTISFLACPHYSLFFFPLLITFKTSNVSSLAWFMSYQETNFITIGQRLLANPLRMRFHYGHSDMFDRSLFM